MNKFDKFMTGIKTVVTCLPEIVTCISTIVEIVARIKNSIKEDDLDGEF